MITVKPSTFQIPVIPVHCHKPSWNNQNKARYFLACRCWTGLALQMIQNTSQNLKHTENINSNYSVFFLFLQICNEKCHNLTHPIATTIGYDTEINCKSEEDSDNTRTLGFEIHYHVFFLSEVIMRGIETALTAPAPKK